MKYGHKLLLNGLRSKCAPDLHLSSIPPPKASLLKDCSAKYDRDISKHFCQKCVKSVFHSKYQSKGTLKIWEDFNFTKVGFFLLIYFSKHYKGYF